MLAPEVLSNQRIQTFSDFEQMLIWTSKNCRRVIDRAWSGPGVGISFVLRDVPYCNRTVLPARSVAPVPPVVEVKMSFEPYVRSHG